MRNTQHLICLIFNNWSLAGKKSNRTWLQLGSTLQSLTLRSLETSLDSASVFLLVLILVFKKKNMNKNFKNSNNLKFLRNVACPSVENESRHSWNQGDFVNVWRVGQVTVGNPNFLSWFNLHFFQLPSAQLSQDRFEDGVNPHNLR